MSVLHPVYTLVLAALIAAAHSALGDRSRRERLYAGAYALLASLGSVFAGGWLMYWIHR